MHRPFRFEPPSPTPAAVLRPRLLEPLARRFEARLVTVEAGAGLGKTTLLAQAVSENRLAPRGRDVWLTCDPADASASILLGDLLLALGWRQLDGPPTVEQVCEAVWAAAPEHVCLVLDDAQHLGPGSGGEAALRSLVEGLPENGHLVVAARRLPDLPRTRLLLQGRAVELSAAQLSLEPDEAAALAAYHGTDAAVLEHVGGWPALAELHARLGTADARRFVWEEVLASLPEADRTAFVFLVGVGGTDAEALVAAMGDAVNPARLATLPLVAVDDRGGLRPHPIWEELLADRIEPGASAAARETLAEVLTQRGDHSVAFELLASAGSWTRALEVLFDACNAQRNPPWRDQMVRWHHLLPPEVADRPEALYLRAMIERAGDAWSDTASETFVAAIAGFRAREDTLREVMATVRFSAIAWLRGDVDAFATFHQRGVELIGQGWPLQPILALNEAITAEIEGRIDDVLARADAVGDAEPRLQHLIWLLRVFARLAGGDADSAVDDAQRAASAALPVMPAAGTGWATFAPTLVSWLRGDLSAVRAASVGDPGPRDAIAERVPPLALAIIEAAHLGDVARARSLLDDLDALVPDIGARHLLAGFRAVAGAAVAIAAGDEAAAATELAEHLDGRPLDPVLAGRALRWFPALPHLLHESSRRLLDDLPSGPARTRALDASRALRAARSGEDWTVPALVSDADALLTVLPAPLAVELVVHAAAARGAGASTAIARLAELSPTATRRALDVIGAGGPPSVSRAARSLLGSVPIPPPHRVRIEVLGPARLLRDGVPIDDANWRRQRVRQLVCAVVAHDEIRRTRLGTLLWPEFDEDGVSSNLRMTLSYLQTLLEPERPKGHAPWFLQQDAGVLRLGGGDHLSVDAWELEAMLDAAAAAAASGAPSVELEHLRAAIGLWRGDYLDDVAGEEWAEPLRERMHSRFSSAAVRAGALLVASGQPRDAIQAAEAALAADPWSEGAYGVLASAHAALGDDDAARRAVEAAARRRAELGLSPDPAELTSRAPR
ncbi:MAG TPA: BTAD domain-containing putative transcriptional regulator [Acidimicrobiales bacterium]|nr:BTAD domain-containing putative transcriptional regulator [Acidimicrobiales bacterium]